MGDLELFPSSITFQNGTVVEFDLDDAVSIDLTNLDREFIRQAKLFARYSTAYEISLKEVSGLKADLDSVSAQVDVFNRKQAADSGTKLTEKMAEHAIKGSVEFLRKNEELLCAQQITGLLKQARDAMIQKKDMLIQLGYNQRQERASDLTMKSEYIKSN